MEPVGADRTHILVLNYNGRSLLAECLPSIVEAALRALADSGTGPSGHGRTRAPAPQAVVSCGIPIRCSSTGPVSVVCRSAGISAVTTCFVATSLVLPILIFDTLVGFLGFGLYLMYCENRDRRALVQHA